MTRLETPALDKAFSDYQGDPSPRTNREFTNEPFTWETASNYTVDAFYERENPDSVQEKCSSPDAVSAIEVINSSPYFAQLVCIFFI